MTRYSITATPPAPPVVPTPEVSPLVPAGVRAELEAKAAEAPVVEAPAPVEFTVTLPDDDVATALTVILGIRYEWRAEGRRGGRVEGTPADSPEGRALLDTVRQVTAERRDDLVWALEQVVELAGEPTAGRADLYLRTLDPDRDTDEALEFPDGQVAHVPAGGTAEALLEAIDAEVERTP